MKGFGLYPGITGCWYGNPGVASTLTTVEVISWVPGGRGWVLVMGRSSLGAMTVLVEEEEVGSSISSSSTENIKKKMWSMSFDMVSSTPRKHAEMVSSVILHIKNIYMVFFMKSLLGVKNHQNLCLRAKFINI